MALVHIRRPTLSNPVNAFLHINVPSSSSSSSCATPVSSTTGAHIGSRHFVPLLGVDPSLAQANLFHSYSSSLFVTWSRDAEQTIYLATSEAL